MAQRRRFTKDEKLRIVQEANACTENGQIGALIRREGIYSSALYRWRQAYAVGGAEALKDSGPGRPATRHPQQSECDRLKRENARLTRALEKAHLIIDVQKKISRILDLPPTSLENGDCN